MVGSAPTACQSLEIDATGLAYVAALSHTQEHWPRGLPLLTLLILTHNTHQQRQAQVHYEEGEREGGTGGGEQKKDRRNEKNLRRMKERVRPYGETCGTEDLKLSSDSRLPI